MTRRTHTDARKKTIFDPPKIRSEGDIYVNYITKFFLFFLNWIFPHLILFKTAAVFHTFSSSITAATKKHEI